MVAVNDHKGLNQASGVRDGEKDTKTCLGRELRELGLNDEFLKERAESRVAWVTAQKLFTENDYNNRSELEQEGGQVTGAAQVSLKLR